MAWIVGYTVHTWELAALRAWAVTFLTASAARLGAPAWLPGPAVLFTVAGLAGIAVSVTGNETAQRYGRGGSCCGRCRRGRAGNGNRLDHRHFRHARRGFRAGMEYCDLPRQFGADRRDGAGRRQHLRGAAMGLHSMAGYAGGFLGPLGVGLVLDLAGGEGMIGWGLAFGHLAIVTLAGLVVLRRLGAERQATPRP